jgi:hypothetical protein
VSETITCGSILLVEDGPHLRQTLARSLQGRDYDLTEAASAAAAVAAARGTSVDRLSSIRRRALESRDARPARWKDWSWRSSSSAL